MKLIYQLQPGTYMSFEEVHNAAGQFYEKFKAKPAVIRMTGPDMQNFFRNVNQQVLVLEANKQYANYIQTPLGPVLLDLIEEDETQVISSPNHSYHSNVSQPVHTPLIIVENNVVDEEFEKHILERK